MREGTMKYLTALACWGAILCSSPASAAGIQLRIGDLTVATTALTSTACLQVPIFLRDPDAPRSLRDLTLTLQIAGDTGIIAGGVATEMLVVNAFTGGSLVGIANPGVNLTNNSSGTGAPSCSLVFNQATEGLGPELSFMAGAQNASWIASNNQGGIGRKQGFAFSPIGQSIGSTVPGQDHLIGVLVVPVVSNPGAAQLTVTATPNNVVADANVYTWGSPIQITPYDHRRGAGAGKCVHDSRRGGEQNQDQDERGKA